MFTRFFYRSFSAMMASDSTAKSFVNALGVTKSSSINSHISNMASALSSFCKVSKGGSFAKCVAFGNGDTTPALDDYQLSGEHFTEYDASCSIVYDDSLQSITCLYTLTNTGENDFTIKEVGVFSSSSSATYACLMVREVLDSPLTIPAGGVGQVTLNLKVALQTS